MKVVLDTNCLLSSHDLTLKPLIKIHPRHPIFGLCRGLFCAVFRNFTDKNEGVNEKVALPLNIFHFQYPIVIFYPAPDGGAGKVCHVMDLRIGQADAHEVADLLLLFRITA